MVPLLSLPTIMSASFLTMILYTSRLSFMADTSTSRSAISLSSTVPTKIGFLMLPFSRSLGSTVPEYIVFLAVLFSKTTGSAPKTAFKSSATLAAIFLIPLNVFESRIMAISPFLIFAEEIIKMFI